MPLNTTEEIIEDIKAGKMVIIMDDEDRENEGDLVMAAECVRPDDINFMARYGRGLICLTLSQKRCQQLRLPLMVGDNSSHHATNFTVSIEAAEGVTTGISAADRAVTVQAAVKPDAKPGDLVQPGHIFPLMAKPGGVLTRAGHTEASQITARLGVIWLAWPRWKAHRSSSRYSTKMAPWRAARIWKNSPKNTSSRLARSRI